MAHGLALLGMPTPSAEALVIMFSRSVAPRAGITLPGRCNAALGDAEELAKTVRQTRVK